MGVACVDLDGKTETVEATRFTEEGRGVIARAGDIAGRRTRRGGPCVGWKCRDGDVRGSVERWVVLMCGGNGRGGCSLSWRRWAVSYTHLTLPTIYSV